MTFKKTYTEALESFKPLKRSKLNRKSGLKSRSNGRKPEKVHRVESPNLSNPERTGRKWGTFKRRSRLNPRGRKVKAWESARRKLKTKFAAMGIMSCELQYAGCWFDNALGFAHAAKRVKLKGDNLYHVILACGPCHGKIEFLPAEEMKRIVDDIVGSRKQIQGG